jgi:hypothetical protein
MNRKLHNTISALVATTGLLVLSLIAASPMPAHTTWSAPDQVTRVGTPALHDETVARRMEAKAKVLEARIDASKSASEAIAHIAAFGAEAATAAVLAEAFDTTPADIQAEPAAPTPRATPRRSRQSVAMPFFSYAPRG